ncbi:MAG: phosphoketolase family protein, partial [Pseudomonadota bacterium]|nr:phosphoketolase family protein [Pseudomonadota bacterium]
GSDPAVLHRQMADTLDTILREIRAIQQAARNGDVTRPRWPMLILRTPKGWTGPKQIDGLKTEDYWRSHQVPFGNLEDPSHLAALEQWLLSYRPRELFDVDGRPRQELLQPAPRGRHRMGANPHTNGGLLLQPLKQPDPHAYALQVPAPGIAIGESTRTMGQLLRDVMQMNAATRNFRVVGPDETASNRLGALFEVTPRTWVAGRLPEDEHLGRDGRVMEILSEHTCQGWLEGYLLTGRHGFFSCYEAFIHIVDSMFNQHAKWLKVCAEVPWRRPIASLNILLTSHVWRQDHNGFSHQDPGFIDVVMNKKAAIVRVYLPPDANTLLCITDRCLRSRNLVNVIVAGKQPQLQWLDMDAAMRHCAAGIGTWDWAGSEGEGEPDLVMACAGDTPTLETIAAAQLLREHVPDLAVRVVNVVDLMTLQPPEEHPNGLTSEAFDALFTRDRPVLFAFHGYPWLIHRLTYRRTNHYNLHVRGYKEEGTTTTPFDMTVRNQLDRFHLVIDAITRVPGLAGRCGHVVELMRERLLAHRQYILQHGDDPPELKDWTLAGAH